MANVHTTVTAHGDAAYRKIQNEAVMALPDGGPLSQYSREQGYQTAQRVTGPDLMKEVLAKSAEKGWRNYFYGSTQETLDLLRKKIEARYPGVQIAGMMSPPFRELTPQEDAEIVKEINATKPDFVWVGLGAPKQERWMAAHDGRVNALMVGVGAAFDYEAGTSNVLLNGCKSITLNGCTAYCRIPNGFLNGILKPTRSFCCGSGGSRKICVNRFKFSKTIAKTGP